MTFSHVLHAAIGLLVIEGRLSYRRLQAEFDLTATQFEALKFELIEVKRLAVDQDGELLAWAGDHVVAAEPRRHQTGAAQPTSGVAVLLPGEVTTGRATDAERRQLTVMFCDLADSTEIFGQARSRGPSGRDSCLSGDLREGHH